MKYSYFKFAPLGIVLLTIFTYAMQNSNAVEHTALTFMGTGKNNIEIVHCLRDDQKNIQQSLLTVEKYWSAKLDYRTYFTKRYNSFISKNNLSFEEIHKYIFYPERIWTGLSIVSLQCQNSGALQISALPTWTQEGYSGTTTFTFDLVNEDDRWLIDLIIY